MVKSKRKNRSKVFTICFIAFFISYFGYTLYQQHREMKSLEIQKNNYAGELEKAQKELDRLNSIIELGDSDEYIEKVAREQLNMVVEGELIIKDISDTEK